MSGVFGNSPPGGAGRMGRFYAPPGTPDRTPEAEFFKQSAPARPRRQRKWDVAGFPKSSRE